MPQIRGAARLPYYPGFEPDVESFGGTEAVRGRAAKPGSPDYIHASQTRGVAQPG